MWQGIYSAGICEGKLCKACFLVWRGNDAENRREPFTFIGSTESAYQRWICILRTAKMQYDDRKNHRTGIACQMDPPWKGSGTSKRIYTGSGEQRIYCKPGYLYLGQGMRMCQKLAGQGEPGSSYFCECVQDRHLYSWCGGMFLRSGGEIQAWPFPHRNRNHRERLRREL